MLSRDIGKKKDKDHLQAFLARLNPPHPPEHLRGGKGERKFREVVKRKLETRKYHLKAQESADSIDYAFDSTLLEWELSQHDQNGEGCCCAKGRKGKHHKEPEVIWKRVDCHSLEEFTALSTSLVHFNMDGIRCLKAIIHSLSFWEDAKVHPEWVGLATLGPYVWVLSFSLQHIVDQLLGRGGEAPPPIIGSGAPAVGLKDVKELFEEMAQSAEVFHNLVENFHGHVNTMRHNMVSIVKRLSKKWGIKENANNHPFSKRPMLPKPIPTPCKRIAPNGAPLEEDDMLDSAFHLTWTPLTILLKSRKHSIDWVQFQDLIVEEQVHWWKIFGQKVLDILSLEAESMTLLADHIKDVKAGKEKCHARAVSEALLSYSQKHKVKSPSEKTRGEGLLHELWFSVDILHEESYRLVKLVRETRDITRTCYVYSDVFYKLDLPSYDEYVRERRGSGGSGARGEADKEKHNRIKNLWRNVVGSRKSKKDPYSATNIFDSKKASVRSRKSSSLSALLHVGEGPKKLSEISEMIVMMDFSTSVYQRILEVKGVEAEDMIIKLEYNAVDQQDSRSSFFGIVSDDVLVLSSKKKEHMDKHKT